jgi:hypothetical protein
MIQNLGTLIEILLALELQFWAHYQISSTTNPMFFLSRHFTQALMDSAYIAATQASSAIRQSQAKS